MYSIVILEYGVKYLLCKMSSSCIREKIIKDFDIQLSVIYVTCNVVYTNRRIATMNS